MYYFVGYPSAVLEWARNHKLIPDGVGSKIVDELTDEIVENLSSLNNDAVVGSLPIRVIARICEKGAKYYDLSLNAPGIPKEQLLKFNNADVLDLYEARLNRFFSYMCVD